MQNYACPFQFQIRGNLNQNSILYFLSERHLFRDFLMLDRVTSATEIRHENRVQIQVQFFSYHALVNLNNASHHSELTKRDENWPTELFITKVDNRVICMNRWIIHPRCETAAIKLFMNKFVAKHFNRAFFYCTGAYKGIQFITRTRGSRGPARRN